MSYVSAILLSPPFSIVVHLGISQRKCFCPYAFRGAGTMGILACVSFAAGRSGVVVLTPVFSMSCMCVARRIRQVSVGVVSRIAGLRPG